MIYRYCEQCGKGFYCSRQSKKTCSNRCRQERYRIAHSDKPRLKVLVACEKWGVVRDAFIARGHDAVSCDLDPTQRPGPHIQGDVRPILEDEWDIVIAFPPCTYLTQTSAPALKQAPLTRLRGMVEAIRFFKLCQAANAPRVAVENPRMLKIARMRLGDPSCKVQPWEHGDPWSKLTYLWLKGLPPLMPSYIVSGERSYIDFIRRTRGSSINSSKTRDLSSRTFPGIALAMAQQWG